MTDLNTQSDAPSKLSPAMLLAWKCLGGTLQWRGTVRGMLGLIRRGLIINSVGELVDGKIHFSESLLFSDGAEQARSWVVEETENGLVIHSEEISMLREGREEDGHLMFDYSVKLGVRCVYRDRFTPQADGGVANLGRARFFGLPIMTIKLSATPAR